MLTPSDPGPKPVFRSSRGAILEDGLLTGLVGAGIVAVWFLVLDSVRAAPFFTPSLLGSVVIGGVPVQEVTSVSTTMVFAYTGLHGVLFLLAGTGLAWMFSQFEENPQFGMVLLLLFIAFESVIFGLEVSVVPYLVGVPGTWAVGLANLFSAIAMFMFLLRRRPEALARLRAGWSD